MLWTQEQIRNPEFKYQVIQDCSNKYGKVDIELADGKIRTGIRQATFNLFPWQILNDFNIPIAKRHFIKRMPMNNKNIFSKLTNYYDEIMEMDIHNGEKLKLSIFNCISELYKFIYDDLLMYTTSVDMMDMAEIMTDPKMKEIIDRKEKITPVWGTNVIEKYIDGMAKDASDLLKKDGGVRNDALTKYHQLGLLNPFQLPQTMLAFGVRTDINDNIVMKPVIGSAAGGLRDIDEYAIESLTAKKSSVYHGSAIQDSQYMGRKIELLVMLLRYIYNHDCGSNVLVPYYVTERDYSKVIGKNIVIAGKLVNITKHNVKNFINTTIYMRSPMTCRYRNGICKVCGGSILENIHPSVNIGTLSAIKIVEPTTQKILSAKHLVKTNSITFELNSQVGKILYCSNISEIRWRPEAYDKYKNCYIGIPLKFMPTMSDISYIRADKDSKEEKLSSVEYFTIKNMENGKEHQYWLANETQIPFLSLQYLIYIRDNFNEVRVTDDVVYIPILNTDKMPIFKTIVQNDSTLRFVNEVNGFLSNRVKDYTVLEYLLRDFCNIIYSKVSNINITHIEILLKAFQMISEEDYRIPIVTDPTHVLHGTITSILNNRFVGNKLAFQGLTSYMSSPQTYLVFKQKSIFDRMVGYQTA